MPTPRYGVGKTMGPTMERGGMGRLPHLQLSQKLSRRGKQAMLERIQANLNKGAKE